MRSRSETLAYPPVWLFRPTTEGFRYVFSSSEFMTSPWNSIYVAAISTLIVLAFAIPAAYALARFSFPARDNVGFYISMKKWKAVAEMVGDNKGNNKEQVGVTTKRKRKIEPWLFLLPATAYVAMVTVYPFLFVVIASFTDWYLLENARHFIGVANFLNLVKDPWFWSSLRITFVFTGSCLLLEHFFGFLLALLLSLAQRVKGWLPLLFMVPMMLPPIVTALIWKLMYRPLGLFNWFLELSGGRPLEWILDSKQVIPSLIVVDIWQWTPFVMLILFSGINSIPSELFEAADIEGGSYWAKVRYVILPLLAPLWTVSVLLRFIYLFTTFDIIAGLTRGGPGQASMTLYYYSYLKSFEWFRLGEAATLNLVILALTMGIGMLALNKILKGGEIGY